MTEDDFPTLVRGAQPAGSGPILRIRHLTGSLAGQLDVFEAGELNLGRRPTCDLVFDAKADFLVSGKHARLFVDAGRQWSVEDLGSTNGTCVNRVAIREATRLSSGDVVVLGAEAGCEGAVQFRVEIDGAAPATADRRATDAVATLPPETLVTPRPVPPPEPAPSTGDAGGPASASTAGSPDRQELRGRLEADQARLQVVRSAAEAAWLELGRRAWIDQPDLRSRYPGAAGLAPHASAIDQLAARVAELEQTLEAERLPPVDGEGQAPGGQVRLEAAATAADEAARERVAAAEQAAAAAATAASARLTVLSRAQEALQVFLDAHAREPRDEFVTELERVLADLGGAMQVAGQPLDELVALFAARVEARQQAEAARGAAYDATLALRNQERERAERQQRVAQLEAELERQREAVAGELAELGQAHAAAFIAFGRELVRADDAVAQQFDCFAAASRSAGELAALELRIAEAESRLAGP